jgi:molybdopterin/thiamine biosynthesis adenylyltransferase
MGVSTAPATTSIADEASVDDLSLSSSILFTTGDVHAGKSTAAANSSRSVNPDFHVARLTETLRPETAATFDSAFWET